MTTKAKLIITAALLAILTAPASARFDGDEGGASAYPRFNKDRTAMSGTLINRPGMQR